MSEFNPTQNFIPPVTGVTDDSNYTSTAVRIDPVTKRVKVNSTITGGVDINPTGTVYNGTKTAPTSTAETIGSQATSSVTVKSLSTNTVSVYVGGSGVTTSNGLELLPGEAISLDTSNLSNIYVVSGSASQVIRYIAI